MKFGCSIGIFLNSTHLICRSMDISKCFRGSPRLRDNESRLHYNIFGKEAGGGGGGGGPFELANLLGLIWQALPFASHQT